eukprot:scaffold456_cov171-Amphora_coffeaeformis.AAC.9
MLVQLDHDECESGGLVRGRVVLTAEEVKGTDSVHFIVRGQEFSLIYYHDEEKKQLASAQADVFYEKEYDYRVPRRRWRTDEEMQQDLSIPFTLPLPEALPSTALLHLTASENFMRIQYKLQVFRTGDGDDTTVQFHNLSTTSTTAASAPSVAVCGGAPSCNASSNIDGGSHHGSVTSSSSSSNASRPSEPMPKCERLKELYFRHTRSSPDATPLLLRAPSWKEPQATSHLHVQIAERLAMVRSAFCGLYDYTTVTFRLLTQPAQLHLSSGKSVRLILTDPDNFLRTWIDTKTKFVLVGKVAETIQWYTSRRFVAYPIHKTWELPEVTFEVEPLTEETKDGVFDEHILLDKNITFPEGPHETFEGHMLSIKSELMLGLCVVDPAGAKLTSGATPSMPLHVRGAGGLALITNEARV